MNLTKLSLRLMGIPIDSAVKKITRLQNPIQRRDAIVTWHKKHNRYYRNLLNGRNVNKFEELPIITKKDLQRPLQEIVSSVFRSKDLFISSTSGSSGHPFYFAKDKKSHALTHAIIQELYESIGVYPEDKQARFYGIPNKGIAKYKERVKDILANRVRFSVFDLSDERLSIYLKRFEKNSFGYVYGYTSAIVQFAKYLIRNEVVLKDVSPRLKCCIVTSEVCLEEDRVIIKKAFGVEVFNEYGCSESGLIAFENKNHTWEIVNKENYVEIVDGNGASLPFGKEGRILLTSLSNKAMPIIRYEVGDIGVINKIEGKLVLQKLSGRVSDLIKLPSGKVAAGLTFYYVSRVVLEKNRSIREFIVRQTAIDVFNFDIVSTEELNDETSSFLQKQLDIYLEPGLKIRVSRVDRINRPASGKIKHFYSEIL